MLASPLALSTGFASMVFDARVALQGPPADQKVVHSRPGEGGIESCYDEALEFWCTVALCTYLCRVS